MNSKWTSHLVKNKDERAIFHNAVLASEPVLKRLSEILTKDLEAAIREQENPDTYDCPNWQLKQIDCNVTRRLLTKIINLCKVNPE